MQRWMIQVCGSCVRKMLVIPSQSLQTQVHQFISFFGFYSGANQHIHKTSLLLLLHVFIYLSFIVIVKLNPPIFNH